jgi:hypothetical protein
MSDSYVSPYPTNADLDLDMLQAQGFADNGPMARHVVTQGLDIRMNVIDPEVATPADRDAMARRIEMMGDLYEEARLLEERATLAGVDTEQLRRVLGEFVAPKPFPPRVTGED